MTEATASDWRRGVIYQIYLKSFADANGDGYGDIAGAITRLPYVAELGVDTVWVSPWFVSPMADGGYDVADYLTIDPSFGSNDDAARFIAESHRLGLKVLVDIVVNHCSREHHWFTAALAAAPGSSEREWFYFRDGRGEAGELPPTDWVSVFGGPAWTRVTEADGTPGQWYLHVFDASQPDLNWYNPAVREAFDDILRYWFDLGVDGLRLDAVPALGKDLDFKDVGFTPTEQFVPEHVAQAPYWDAGEVHDVVRRWRGIAESYSPPRYLVGEIVVSTPEALLRYLRPDELQSVFAFDLTKSPWRASELTHRTQADLRGTPDANSWPTWHLSSHDEVRTVTRYGTEQGLFDAERGTRRARAALMLSLALPGGACIYQGEELGLPQVTDLPRHVLQDPIVARTGDPSRGRDGCRVPMPWNEASPSFGFSTAASWLPQPATWSSLSVEHQRRHSDSTLHFVQELLRIRRDVVASRSDEVIWRDESSDVVSFARGDFVYLLNMGTTTVPVPVGFEVLVSNEALRNGVLHTDQAVWLRRC